METKIADLCGKCAAIYSETFNVKRIAGGCEHKVLCSHCGRKHYGGTYEISPKNKKGANQ